MYEHILLDIDKGIATITFNRPDKLNAYIVAMGEEVVSVFDSLRNNEEVKVIIITGAGRGFCAGVDLEHLKQQFATGTSGDNNGPKLGEERFVRELPMTLVNYPKPVIAAMNGHAIGVGITMALGCDIRIAADTAKIGLTFAKMGILPGLGSTYLLPRLVGPAKARELVLTGKIILAPEAAEIGLVNRVVPADQLMNEARAIAEEMVECNPQVLAMAKKLMHAAESGSLEQAMKAEQASSAELRR